MSSQPMIGGSFDLVDHDGREVSDESYRGRYVLITFGFTHCRVVCPRALTKLSTVLEQLGPLADRILPLYITVDPERDTPEVMKNFLRSYPRFIGLTGSPAQIDRAKRAFRVFAARRADETDGYVVPHTAIAHLLNQDGRYVNHFPDAIPGEEIVVRLRQLLERDGSCI